MSKNSLSSNFTGSGSKRAKKHYSDKDAGRHYFKPDHSEYYPGSKKKEIVYSHFDDNSYDENISNQESSRPEIDIHETNGAASIRVKTAKEIAVELNPRNVINRGSIDKQKKYQKKELLDVMLMNDEYDQDLLPYRGSMQSTNKVEFYDPKRPHAVRRMKKNDSAKNSKTNNNFRPWQEEQRNGGEDQILFNDIEKNPENDDIDIPVSSLEIALENHPNFIREDDQPNEHKVAA